MRTTHSTEAFVNFSSVARRGPAAVKNGSLKQPREVRGSGAPAALTPGRAGLEKERSWRRVTESVALFCRCWRRAAGDGASRPVAGPSPPSAPAPARGLRGDEVPGGRGHGRRGRWAGSRRDKGAGSGSRAKETARAGPPPPGLPRHGPPLLVTNEQRERDRSSGFV